MASTKKTSNGKRTRRLASPSQIGTAPPCGDREKAGATGADSQAEEAQMQTPSYEELIAEVEAGSRVPTQRERAALLFEELLALQAAERRVLDRMGPEQRLRLAGSGQLSAHQRGAWAANYSHEVPWVNRSIEGEGGIPPWIAATLVDIVEDGVNDG